MTTLLIVDDEPEIAELLALNLGRRGFDCHTAGCAEEAVAAAQHLRPDLILMDMSIPLRPGGPEDDEGGRRAVREITATPGMANMPVIAVTGHTEPHRVARFREAGCVDVINKPPDYDLLNDRIRRLIGIRAPQPATISAARPMPREPVEPRRFDITIAAGSFGEPGQRFGQTVSVPDGRLTPSFENRTPRTDLDVVETALRTDERRGLLAAERVDYRRKFDLLLEGIAFARQMIDEFSPERCGHEWEHQFRNAVARIQGRIENVREIERETLHEEFDPLLDQTERVLRTIVFDLIPAERRRNQMASDVGRGDAAGRRNAAPLATAPRGNTSAAASIAAPAAPQSPRRRVDGDVALSTDGVRRTDTILVADDNADGRSHVANLLRRDGHDVVEAEDGCDAMNRLRESRPGLVILDLEMPGLSGMDVLKQMKDEAALRRIPVLMVSGSGQLEQVVEAIRLGAEDYLTKPVDATLLRVRIDAALERERLRRKDLEDFFPPEIIEAVENDPGLLKEPRTGVDVTLLICDIRGFSRITEELRDSTLVLRWLNAVMSQLTQCVLDAGGTVVDYIGDELLAMWGAPTPGDDHAQRACTAAQAMLAVLPELNDRWRGTIRGSFDLGIGLNSGPVHVGNTGSSRRFKYGPLGNAVNIASRIQGATKYTRTNVLITGETRRRLQDRLHTRRLGRVRTVNISEPIEIYELLDAATAADHFADLTGSYEDALVDFEAGRLQEAIRKLGALIGRFPSDGPSLVLLSRAVQMQLGGGTADPVWDLPGK